MNIWLILIEFQIGFAGFFVDMNVVLITVNED